MAVWIANQKPFGESQLSVAHGAPLHLRVKRQLVYKQALGGAGWTSLDSDAHSLAA